MTNREEELLHEREIISDLVEQYNQDILRMEAETRALARMKAEFVKRLEKVYSELEEIDPCDS